MKKYLAFRDKTPMEECDLHYTPTGIICNTSEIIEKGCRSWKDYSVIYFDVQGKCCSEWRGVEEVEVFAVSKESWEQLDCKARDAEDTPYIKENNYDRTT
jgi:hypothetical protein